MRPRPPQPIPQDYERPGDTWVCGLACEGRICGVGPTPSGHCRELPGCRPLRHGDRWVCALSPSRGGPCQDGPSVEGACGERLRCRPVRSAHAARRRLMTSLVLAGLALVVVVLSISWRNGIFSPGPLSPAHRQELAGVSGRDQCVHCHGAASQSLAAWFFSTAEAPWAGDQDANDAQRPGVGESMSRRCRACHGRLIPEEHPMRAHQLPLAALRPDDPPGAKTAAFVTSVACARCHREHQGSDKLSRTTDAQCHTCHRVRFTNFATDHPPFRGFPRASKTGISFDHRVHRDKHFPGKNEKFSCAACHAEDAEGEFTRGPGYEAACARCHDAKLLASVEGGIPVIRLPTIDVALLAKHGWQLAEWPEEFRGDFDGQLPTVLRALLGSDDSLGDSLATLGSDADFANADSDRPEHLRAAWMIAQAIRERLVDPAHLTASAPERSASTPRVPNEPVDAKGQTARATARRPPLAGLAPETLRTATDRWFPNSVRAPSTSGQRARPQESPAARGSWAFEAGAIRYHPLGHGDPWLEDWLGRLQSDFPDAPPRWTWPMIGEPGRSFSIGLCTMCHTRFPVASEAKSDWLRPRAAERLTRFKHRPHIAAGGEESCAACHRLESGVVDEERAPGGFQQIEVAQCSVCHNSRTGGDNCLTCHRYHP